MFNLDVIPFLLFSPPMKVFIRLCKIFLLQNLNLEVKLPKDFFSAFFYKTNLTNWNGIWIDIFIFAKDKLAILSSEKLSYSKWLMRREQNQNKCS